MLAFSQRKYKNVRLKSLLLQGKLMKVIITGCDGYVGSHLAGALLNSDNKIYGTYLITKNLIPKGVNSIKCDILKYEKLKNILTKIKPEIIYHFAAQSSVGLSHNNPGETFRINVIGTLNIVDIIKKYNLNTKFIFISSSEVYGNTGSDPVYEDFPLKPLNPYGSSKVAGEGLVLQYANSYNLNASIIRPFPQLGEYQSTNFVIPSFASQIVKIKLNLKPSVIKVGNLKTFRSFINIHDAVDCYRKFMEIEAKGEIFNLSGEEIFSIEDILHQMIEIADIKTCIEIDENLLRSTDIPYQIGSSDKIKRFTKWSPKRTIRQALVKVLEVIENEYSSS